MTPERETARRVFAYRKTLASGRAASVVDPDGATGAEGVDQVLQLLGRRVGSFVRQLIRKGGSLAHRCCGHARHGAAGGDDVGENEMFDRLYPVLQSDFHAASPSIEIGTLADEEKRIAALVVTHRLSETRK